MTTDQAMDGVQHVKGRLNGPMVGALRAALPALVVAAGAAAYPFLLTDFYYLRLGTEVIIHALLATSLNMLVGYTGMVSLGHAGFFGLGAYCSGILLLQLDQPLEVGIIAGVVGAAGAAYVIGTFCVRTAEVYFAMLTLAFGQLLFVISYYWVSMTGGDDGLVGIPAGRFATPGLKSLDLNAPATSYLVVLAFASLGFVVYRVLVGSSFGMTLRAVRENRLRVTFTGGDVARIRRRVFVLAGAGAGLAGALYAPFQGFISPEILYWTKSGEILLATVLGGMFSFWGPALGGGLMLSLKDLLIAYLEYWKIVLGMTLLLIVLFMPGGLMGFLDARLADLRRYGRRAAD